MRGLVGPAVAVVIFFFWHTLRGWQVPLTDGHQWKQIDSCHWILQSRLPYFTQSRLERGDKLRRIDYKSPCYFSTIPPDEVPGRLYLYEVDRGEAVYVVFVESMLPFVLGWPLSEAAYAWTERVSLWVVLIMGFMLILIGKGYRRENRIAPLELLSLGSGLLSAALLWLLWAGKGRYPPELLSMLFLAAWTGWTVIRLVPPWWLLSLLPLTSLPFLLKGYLIYPVSEAILGLSTVGLPLPWSFVYVGLWSGWLIWKNPLFLPFMMVPLTLGRHWNLFQRMKRLLSLWDLAFSLSAIGIGTGITIFLQGREPLFQLLSGSGATLSSALLMEGMRQLIQNRQRRVRLLQERLPQLWERVERGSLLRFAEETLRAYADIEKIQIVNEEKPSAEARAWLRRTEEPCPCSLKGVSFVPDAALPLPSYGWLLLKEGRRRLRLEDTLRLLPFAAGLSIALRHAELLEAAHEARLAALRGQLSPHFLFNALNTLQSLIGENPTLAEALMIRLGGLLRRSLAHARQVTVPLEEELALVEDYLAVEQQRFGQRLRVVWQVPTPCPVVEVPPFTVQLLAENVIKHAVSRLTRPVKLEIQVFETPTHVLIQVIDDGPGIDPTQVGKSVGLSNLMARLDYLYGTEAALHAERLTYGTRITITLPHPYRRTSLVARTQNLGEGPAAHGK
ncbi:MAG: histidine kinase [Bacteroidia bacterium]|nr:histidine kinase [Bacteroidia bacterium]